MEKNNDKSISTLLRKFPDIASAIFNCNADEVRQFMTQMLENEFLIEDELATRWKSSKKFLQKLRVEGGGPTFTKFGSLVRYSIIDVLEYEKSNRFTNTSGGKQ